MVAKQHKAIIWPLTIADRRSIPTLTAPPLQSAYKHKRRRRRQVEQHTHRQGLCTDTTHIRPPDQRILYWYYTKPTRTTDRAIITTENHQSTITSKCYHSTHKLHFDRKKNKNNKNCPYYSPQGKERSKSKDKETRLHSFTRTSKAKTTYRREKQNSRKTQEKGRE